MPEYSIVIPCFNESGKITSSLTQILTFMPTFCSTFEVIVVDDGSTDDSVAKIKEYQKNHNYVRLIENQHKGKGPTVWTGVMEALGDYIYMADADLSAPIDSLKKLSIWIKEHDYDIVIASREGFGAKRLGEPLYRHIMGRIFNFLVQALILPGIKDSQCGFKLFKGDVAKDVFGRLSIYGRSAEEQKGAYLGAFDVEVLFIAKKLGYKIKEAPIEWTYVKTSRLNPVKDSLKMARDVLRIKLNGLKGAYKI